MSIIRAQAFIVKKKFKEHSTNAFTISNQFITSMVFFARLHWVKMGVINDYQQKSEQRMKLKSFTDKYVEFNETDLIDFKRALTAVIQDKKEDLVKNGKKILPVTAEMKM